MNITKLAALSIAAIVITGFATTLHAVQFNLNDKEVAFVDENPYFIPVGSHVFPKEVMEIDKDSIADLNSLQISHNCKSGDRMWMNIEYANSITDKISSIGKYRMNKEEVEALYRHSFRDGLVKNIAGCSSALSATVHDHYKNVEIQMAQQVRHQQNLQKQQGMIDSINSPRSCITNFGYTTCR